jgi:hypothetical protein
MIQSHSVEGQVSRIDERHLFSLGGDDEQSRSIFTDIESNQ